MNVENERIEREVETTRESEIEEVSVEEVRRALQKMKRGKAVGPDDIPAEAWKLTDMFNKIIETKKMLDEWRKSTLVPIFKNKGDIQECENYRGIKLVSHTLKIWERVIESRLREMVNISQEQFGFMPGRSTTDAIFALRQVVEKYREGRQNVHCVLTDMEKAYDRVPRAEVWNCLRLKGVPGCVRLIQDM